MNKAIICGRLGRDPELRHTQKGSPVCSFSVATDSGKKDADPDWHNVVAWGTLGENCNKYLVKGREVLVEGKLSTRSWETDAGEKRYKTEIVAFNVQFLGGKDEKGGVRNDTPTEPDDKQRCKGCSFSDDDDDIPF